MFLYIVCDVSESVVKIGYSTDPESRCRSLQTGYPLPLRVYYTVRVDRSRVRLLERKVHFELGPYSIVLYVGRMIHCWAVNSGARL